MSQLNRITVLSAKAGAVVVVQQHSDRLDGQPISGGRVRRLFRQELFANLAKYRVLPSHLNFFGKAISQ